MATGHAPTRHLFISLPICVTSSNTTVRNSGNARNRLRAQCFFHRPFPAFIFSLHSISSLSSLRTREIADIWGGNGVSPSVNRDRLHRKYARPSSCPLLTLTALAYLRSKLDIYRTMPKRLGPDLRLGVSDSTGWRIWTGHMLIWHCKASGELVVMHKH
ncbi:hypothetical protein FIBSPDRAFT_271336 [Athelia psychrophila]|uniref:Uncharacterized protein n=1 Tax=Athelia psychrophila TaxID=1759441 RepID=A0A165WX69_9AGAM|nr:hypothetical protein FIBSPDRAFT_271336 [Fibularhizoctonia sp. CBS 109695]